MIYVCAILAFSAIYSPVVSSNVPDKSAVVMPLSGQQQILVNNWYLPPETCNFPQRVDFLYSEFQIEFHQFAIICVNLNAITHSVIQLPDLHKEEIFSERRYWMLTVLFWPLPKTPQQMTFLCRMSPSYTSPFRNCLIGHRVTLHLLTYHHHTQPAGGTAKG